MNRANRHPRASALLLVLWALLTLSAVVFAWATWIQDDLALHSEANRTVEARAMARSGMTLALHPGVTRLTPLPEETLAPGQSYRVQVVSEGGKLNINWLLSGEEPRKLNILRQWLERRGLDFEQREVLVDSLLDYVDGDDLKRLNGSEGDDEYHPANRALQSVQEITRIPGAARLTAQPGWDDDLTIFSQGPIDLSAASVEILRLLPGLGETRLQQFVQYRQGVDGLDGTPDDPVFQNLDMVRQFLGLSAAQFKELGGLVTYQDPTLHITSTGQSGKVSRQLEVIVRKGAGRSQILLWKE
jgi:type II secretory pathway component PulK